MRLSDLINLGNDIKIKRDAYFDSLGMATTKFKDNKVLSFLSDELYLDEIRKNKNIIALVTSEYIYSKSILPEKLGIIVSENPKLTFYKIHNVLAEKDFYSKKFDNVIDKSSKISSQAIIGNNNIIIGKNSIIEPGVVIHNGSIIGNNVIIRSGSQIGTNGFQFLNLGETVLSVKTTGRTIIEDNVEIQHNCCIDRGVLGGDTIISHDVKIDNLVYIAHDDFIGERTFITAGVKLAGRVIIGRDCWIGVNATISNGINIGNNCKITLGSVVTKDVPDNQTVSGNFAIEHSKFINFIKSIR
ncbi:MAG: UDP-3-O-(3-hydroxymyristoyl)glucosamine N-acyltransferase [Acholeplasma sp.]|nr:UDP-3-O-(3-hydroxymyristoyl)glucosamine N-acyltransferase [Acholeplasma sp.]